MLKLSTSLRPALAIWMRNATVYKNTWFMNLLPNFFEPVLYLFAMGIGLGFYVKDGVGGLDYIVFIGPGLVASSAMNGASFEATYNMFVRMYFNKIYNAYLATPTQVKDIVYGEILWATTRATLYGLIFFFIIGMYTLLGTKIVTSPLAVFVPFTLVLIGALFSVIGAFFTASIKTIDWYAYYFTLFITPSFLFSGIFYPVDRFPFGAKIAWCTPLYHAVHLMRGLIQGPFDKSHIVSLIWLVVVTGVLYVFIPKKMSRKLTD